MMMEFAAFLQNRLDRTTSGYFSSLYKDAANTDSGLIEATEVMEVQPFDLNKSTCYSDIRFCDPRGALYIP